MTGWNALGLLVAITAPLALVWFIVRVARRSGSDERVINPPIQKFTGLDELARERSAKRRAEVDAIRSEAAKRSSGSVPKGNVQRFERLR